MYYGPLEDRRCSMCKLGGVFQQNCRLELHRYTRPCSKCARTPRPPFLGLQLPKNSKHTMEEVREIYLRSIRQEPPPGMTLEDVGPKVKPVPKIQPTPTTSGKIGPIVQPRPPTPNTQTVRTTPMKPIIPVALITPTRDIAHTIPNTQVKIRPVIESLPSAPNIQSVPSTQMKQITPITPTAPTIRENRQKPLRINECVQTPMVKLITEACQTNPVTIYYNIAEESDDAEDVVLTAGEEKPVAASEKATNEMADKKFIGGAEKYKQIITERNEIIKYLSEIERNKSIKTDGSEEANVESTEEVKVLFSPLTPTVSERSSIDGFVVKEVKLKECQKLHMKPMFDYLGYFAIFVLVAYIVYYNFRKTYHIMLGVEELGESRANEGPTFISDCWKIVSNISYHLCAKWIDLIAS